MQINETNNNIYHKFNNNVFFLSSTCISHSLGYINIIQEGSDNDKVVVAVEEDVEIRVPRDEKEINFDLWCSMRCKE